MFSSKDLFFTPAVSTGYTVSKSLRFRSSASAYLSRTPASAGNRKTWTWSAWVKRGALVNGATYNNSTMFSAGSANPGVKIAFDKDTNNDAIQVNFTAGTNSGAVTTSLYRDVSAWYHILVAVDTTQATASNRVKIYVNSSQVTAFNTSNYPALNTDYDVNNTVVHNIGRASQSSAEYFDGYLAEVNFIDGQALTPSSFGAYDTNGVWQPAAYTGSYGTNGFYLKFTDVGATSGSNTGYGKDFVGTNYWTTNNFGTTSTATTYDSMLDSPTNAAGDIGNYCVLNPLDPTVLTLSSGNLDATYATNSDAYCTSTFRVSSGKWYWEYNITSVGGTYAIVGISSAAAASVALGSTASTYAYISSTGNKYNNGSATAYGNTYTSGAVVAVALDMDNGKLYFGLVSGGTITWQNTGDPVAGTNAAFTSLSGLFTPAINGRNSSNVSLNAGQRPFSASTLPSGFSALNTQNLTTPTITNGAQYMAAVLYTGTGSSQTITASSTNSGNNPNGTTFQPDWVWVKGRSGATDHALYDAVRGVQLQIESNTTTAETTETTGLTAFTSSGFTTGALAQMNTNTATYVAWEWKAGGTGVSNTSGSITSTVSANTSAGFSVVTFTAPNSASPQTFGHGLGVAPSMIFIKIRNTTGSWQVYHASIGNTQRLLLNTTDAATTTSGPWNNTSPSSTVVTIGTTFVPDASASTYVAYCFAPVSGYSAFGSYTANASTDGPMVFTNFRPRFVLLKNTTRAADWIIYDSSRDLYNTETQQLYPNLTSAEASGANIDFLSNGFKIRAGSGSGINNTSGDVYIYAAFAENPFKISRAR